MQIFLGLFNITRPHQEHTAWSAQVYLDMPHCNTLSTTGDAVLSFLKFFNVFKNFKDLQSWQIRRLKIYSSWVLLIFFKFFFGFFLKKKDVILIEKIIWRTFPIVKHCRKPFIGHPLHWFLNRNFFLFKSHHRTEAPIVVNGPATRM